MVSRENSRSLAMTPEFVADALGAVVPPHAYDDSDARLPFTGVTTDSREVTQGSLFVALAGERVDGHAFVDCAVGRGARGVVCRAAACVPLPAGIWCFPVADSLHAYRALASHWRRQFTIPVVAVAGSAGKTTTKDMLGAILSGKYDNALVTRESCNGWVGIPRTLLELRAGHRAAVIEVGIDEPGAMLDHMTLIGATISIVTAVGPEHLENLVDLPTVAREEGYALSIVAADGGVAVVNLDDPWLRPFHAAGSAGRSIGYSMGDEENVGDVLRGRLCENDSVIEVGGLGLDKAAFRLPLPGLHNATNALGAIAIARTMSLSKEEIEAGIATMRQPEGRSAIHHLPGSVRVICDYYNANPSSVRAGLQLLRSLSRASESPTSSWACLADMLELGDSSERYHRELASDLAQFDFEHVLLFGSQMKLVQEHLEGLGFRGDCRHFSGHSEMAVALAGEATKGAIVFIKGSRGMKMERMWDALRTAWESRSNR